MTKKQNRFFQKEARTYKYSEEWPLNLIPKGEKWKSVTEVLKIISKPAIAGWKQKIQGIHTVGAVEEWAADWEADNRNFPTIDQVEAMVKASKQAWKKESEKALADGTTVHLLCEATLNGKMGDTLDYNPEVWNAYTAFLDWREETGFEAIDTETKIVSPDYQYAGTVDAIGKIDGELVLIDFKTSKSMYREYCLQNSAYQIAWENLHHRLIDRNIVLRLPKDGKPAEEILITDIANHFEAFLAAKALHDWEREDYI